MILRASLFDMDGLLIDSEVLWQRAEAEILGGLGVPIRDDPRATKGRFVNEVVQYWHAQAPWASPSIEEVVEQLLTRVGDLVEAEGRLLPGARRALALAEARGPLGLASSTPRPLLERCLRHFDLVRDFAVVHSADVEPFGKPHPGVFLSAAASLDVAPEQCLVFEDSAAGVLAARAARMSVVAVPAREDRDDGTFALADLVLDSLEDLDEDWLDERFA